MILLQIFGQNVTQSPGTGTFASHTWEILLITLGAFLLGWFLNYLRSMSLKSRISDLEADLRSSKAKLKTANEDLATCNSRVVDLKGENTGLNSRIKDLEARPISVSSAEVESDAAVSGLTSSMTSEQVDHTAGIVANDLTSSEEDDSYDADGARSVFGKKVNEDDLKIVEGIGPKTEEILNGSSINTWRQLSNTSVPQIQSILSDAGDRFQLLNPGTWPKQAGMAADGQWSKLKDYQDYLVGGVEPGTADSSPPASSEPTSSGVASGTTQTFDGDAAKAVFGKKIKQDDLRIVEGIGPKIAELLQNDGILTWRGLSNANLDRIQGVLDAAGPRYQMHNPSTWAKQAGMAADGQWQQLLDYQDRLVGGVEPS